MAHDTLYTSVALLANLIRLTKLTPSPYHCTTFQQPNPIPLLDTLPTHLHQRNLAFRQSLESLNPAQRQAVERIEGWRALGDNVIETIINKSETVKDLKGKAKTKDLSAKEKKQLTDEEKEFKSKRKLVELPRVYRRVGGGKCQAAISSFLRFA